MNKSLQKFDVGDFVFAKVSGHPYWPAKIAAQIPESSYLVLVVFYGGLERAICVADKIKPYNDDTKKLYNKYPNAAKKDFIESIRQIDEALKGGVDKAAIEISEHVAPKENQKYSRERKLLNKRLNDMLKRRAQLKLKIEQKTKVSEPAAKPKINKKVCDVKVPTIPNQNSEITESLGVLQQSEDPVASAEVREPKKSRVEDDLIQDLALQELLTIQFRLNRLVNTACESLGFDAAYPDRALECLNQIEKLLEKVQKTMLLRDPQVFSSMVQLSKYVGNTSSEARFWKNFNKQQLEEFNGKALRVREIAGVIVERFKKLLPELPHEPTVAFANAFNEESNKFKADTANKH